MKLESQQKLFEINKKALLAAGAIIRKGFHKKINVKFKTVISPVTQVDVAAEKKIISLISSQFPDHAFLGEESAFVKNEKLGPANKDQYRWVIDPLDGTVNFIHHIPQSSVSIAVERNGVVLVGGVYDVHRDELFMAVKGKGATLNGKKIQVSKEKDFRRSLMITGFPYERGNETKKYLNTLDLFLGKTMDVRRFGSAAIDLSWIACGRAEGYWESKLSPWDVAAGSLLVEEAGGRITNFQNKRFDINKPLETLASNGLVHKLMVKNFRQFLT